MSTIDEVRNNLKEAQDFVREYKNDKNFPYIELFSRINFALKGVAKIEEESNGN